MPTKGIDDVLAMLLALSAKPEELDILMLSLTFGNVEVQKYVCCFPCGHFLSVQPPLQLHRNIILLYNPYESNYRSLT